MIRIPVNPEPLTGACERAGLDALALAGLAETSARKFHGGNP